MYSRKELDEQYELLSEAQKTVLDEYVRRGKRTKWLNAWTHKIGDEIDCKALHSIEDFEDTLAEWDLIDYEDFGTVRKDIRCECGRTLRYRYTIRHTITGKIYKLGAVHFQDHLGISPQIAQMVLKEFKKIDLERDEILSKVKENWTLTKKIPEEVEVPEDMKEQISVMLPLLERQLKRLERLIGDYYRAPDEKVKSKKEQIMLPFWGLDSEIDSEVEEMPVNKRLDEKHMLYKMIDPHKVLEKLKNNPKSLKENEIEALYNYLKENTLWVKEMEISKLELRKMILKAEAQIIDQPRRHWLIEMEDLVIL